MMQLNNQNNVTTEDDSSCLQEDDGNTKSEIGTRVGTRVGSSVDEPKLDAVEPDKFHGIERPSVVSKDQNEGQKYHQFLNITVRCMRYRSYVRWYHGSYSSRSRAGRLVIYYLVALLCLLISFVVLCGRSSAHYQRYSTPLLISTSFFIAAGVMFAVSSQTPKVAALSIFLSRCVCMASVFLFVWWSARGTARCRFFPSSILIVFNGIQLALATMASIIDIAFTPLARWYIFRSNCFIKGYSASGFIRTDGRILLRACPFDCMGAAHTFQKWIQMKLHIILSGGRKPLFSPSERYLPDGTLYSTASVEPCCPFCAVYSGDVDQKFRPHGLGTWRQGHGYGLGEFLHGYWEKGRPVAPFASRQNVCGSGFTALRFAWFQVPDEKVLTDQLKFGIIDVECSVFGKFFRRFPKYIYWEAPSLKELSSIDEEMSLTSTARIGLTNRLSSFSYLNVEVPPSGTENKKGLDTQNETSTDENSDDTSEVPGSPEVPGSNVDENNVQTVTKTDSSKLEDICYQYVCWLVDKLSPVYIPGERVTRGRFMCSNDLEAMIFIHGYKTPLAEAPVLLGQLIALGGFPNKIKPFMYLWPAGTQLWHYEKAKKASQNKICQVALYSFLKALIRKGIRDIHIVAHSMGSRLFMNTIMSDPSRRDIFWTNHNPDGALKLVNLVFLHPEYFLDDFIFKGGYEAAAEISGRITMYCHARDEALKTAELFTRKRCMGRHPFAYVRAHKDTTGHISNESIPRISRESSLVPTPSDLECSSMAHEWLNLDVIDCTYLDANVHSLRHCFFNLNSSVVGDIRDVMVSRAQASQRSQTLERRDGNVYTFRTAPGDLSTIFGV